MTFVEPSGEIFLTRSNCSVPMRLTDKTSWWLDEGSRGVSERALVHLRKPQLVETLRKVVVIEIGCDSIFHS